MKLKYDINKIADQYGIRMYWDMVQKNNPANDKPYHNLFHLNCVVKYCYEMAKSMYLEEHKTRLLLLAAMYHDFGHFSATNDYLNVIKAKQIFRVHSIFMKTKLSMSDIDEVENVIAATQFPYVIAEEELNIFQKIIRDADLLQWTEDTFIDHVVKGIAEELDMSILDFAPKQRAFMKSMKFYTVWAQERYDQYLETRLLELDTFVNDISAKLNHKRIILVARAASGKDFLRQKFIDKGFIPSISITTRPPRPGEIDGKDYLFVSKEEADDMIRLNMFYEYVSFNGWIYGTTNDQFYKDEIFIMTPAGLSHVKPDDRKNSIVIYLDIPWEVRKERLALRAMPGDTVERRLESDDKDFKDFKDFDVRITNPDF